MAFGDRSVKLFLKGDATGLERALTKAEVRLKGFERVAGKQSTVANSGLLGSFSKSGAIVSGIGLGVLALKNVTDAAKNAQVILGQTSVAVEDAGLSWEKYGKQVQDASLTISKSSAFDDEQVLQSFSVFVRGQKNVAKSIQLAQLAADVARGRYTDLASATQLVNKAALGQIGALRRAGIAIDKNATSTQALIALQAAYGGSAVRYANTAAGAQDRLRVSVENLRESLGGRLLPALTIVVNEANKGVTTTDKVTSAFKKLGVTGHGVGNALKVGFFATPNPLTPVIGQIELMNKLFGDTKKQLADLNTLAASFAASINGVGAINLNPGGKPSVGGQATPPTAAGGTVDPGVGKGGKLSPANGDPHTIPVGLQNQEADARLSGSRKRIRDVLEKEAKFIQNQILNSVGEDQVQWKQALLGVVGEIKSLDQSTVQEANDRKKALQDVKNAQRAAHQRAIAALKAQAQAFKDQAGEIKSAILNAFDTKTDKIHLARDLADAKKTLRQAKQLGGAGSIKIAQQGLFDANRAIARQKIVDSTIRVTEGPKGPVNTVSIGNVTINVNTSDPDKAGAAVLKALQRSSRHNTVQGRGRIQGKSLGVN